MSKKLFLLPALLLGAMIMFAPACGDKCEKKDCGSGICDEVDGSCNCDPGYEYDADGSCTVEERTKLIGGYNTTELCTGDPAPFPYELTITAGAGISDVNIFNFFNSFMTTAVKATVSGNTITIATQKPNPTGSLQVQGSGTISTNSSGKVEIALNYTVVDTDPGGFDPVTCSSTVLIHK